MTLPPSTEDTNLPKPRLEPTPPSVDDNSRPAQPQPMFEWVAPPPSKPPSGSLWAGMGLAWLIGVVGHAGTFKLFETTRDGDWFDTLFFTVPRLGNHFWFTLWPEGACFVVAIGLFMNGKKRTDSGMLIGMTCVMVVWISLLFAVAVLSEMTIMAPR